MNAAEKENPKAAPTKESQLQAEKAPIITFEIGDVVVGIAGKSKDQFDQRRGTVEKLLSKKVRVRLLEGPFKGRPHDYDHDKVIPIQRGNQLFDKALGKWKEAIAQEEASKSVEEPQASTSAASASSGSAPAASRGASASSEGAKAAVIDNDEVLNMFRAAGVNGD